MALSFQKAKNLIKALKKKGYESYIVGGAVRDFIMKKEPIDIDITTKAKPTDVMRHFNSVPTGLKYGTVTVEFEDSQFEVTTFRLDGPTKDFRHPDSVIYSDNVKDDVLRRDFTINGLLMDENERIYDHVGGLEDIKHEVIRTIGNPYDRFNEDALRILRALYFQSKLGFRIDEETKQAMKDSRFLIKEISRERVFNELIKTLKGPYLKLALETMIETQIDEVLPGLKNGINYISKLDKLPFVDPFFVVSFILNQGIVPEYWPFSNYHKNMYQKAVILSMKTKDFITPHDLYEYGLEISILANKANTFLGKSRYTENDIENAYQKLPIKSELDLALNSQEIMTYYNKKPGLWLGKLKKALVNDVLSKKVKNEKAALLKHLESMEV